MDEIVENKNPGNGTTVEDSAELEPLKGGNNHSRHEMMRADLGDLDDFDKEDCLEKCSRKCRLTPKKGLLYLIVTSSIIFLLLLILIIMAVLWPSSSVIPVCETSECHYFSSKMLSGINLTQDPCEEIFEYTCGEWLQRNPIPKSKPYWSTVDLEKFEMKAKLRTLINTLTFAEKSNSVELKMRRFYQSCMNLEYVESDKAKPLTRLIQNLGGWEILKTFRATDFDFPRVLRKVHKDFRASPFFNVGVEPDPRDPARNIIKISPSGLSLPDKSYYFMDSGEKAKTDCSARCKQLLLETLQKKYFEEQKSMPQAFKVFAKDVAQELGATSPVAMQFAEKIFNYEKRIAEITPDKLDLIDPLKAFKIIRVSELKATSSNIFWVDLLKALFTQGNINDNTDVLIPSSDYIQQISSIISTTDRGDLNNYLMWQLTQQFLPFLSKNFIEVLDFYSKETLGTSESLPRWEFCIDKVIEIFPHAVNNLLSDHVENRLTRKSRIDQIFESMRFSLSERISSVTRLDESMRNYVLDKLRLMSIQIGTSLRNITILNDLYFGLDVQKDEFFTNIVSAIRFIHEGEQKELANPTKDSSNLAVFAKHPYQIIYTPSMNKIFFPESAIQNEVLSLDTPHLPIIYGSVGVKIGEAIARAFGIEKGLYLSDGILMSERDYKVQETRDLVEQKRSCIASFFTNIRLDKEPYVVRSSLDTTIHLSGIQIAMDALKILSDSSEFHTLPALDKFSANALFFLSYGQSQCFSSTLQYHDLEHNALLTFSKNHRVKGLLRQIITFSKAFSCSRKSEMYADFTCDDKMKVQFETLLKDFYKYRIQA